MSLELGGNAPFLAFDDADIDSTVDGAIASKFRDAGQTCACANRIDVQAGVHDSFVEKLAAEARLLKVGNGLAEGVVKEPPIEQAALQKVQRHLEEQFFEPSVVADATADMLCAHEKTFVPLAPVFRFNSEQEAADLANHTGIGLASCFSSRDVGRIFRVAEALEYGMVGINARVIATEHAPFGGTRQSGLGREGSRHGIDDDVEMEFLCIGDIAQKP